MAILIILAAAMAGVTLIVPEVAALLGLAAFYLNLPGIAVTVHGVSSFLAGAAFLLLVGPLAVRLARREPIVADRPFLLLLVLLAVILMSTFAVQDLDAARGWLTTFLTEGLLMYFVTSNLFRTWDRLGRALNVILICGAILGGLTVYQEATRSYREQFAGLAQRNLEYESREAKTRSDPFHPTQTVHVSNRAAGPIGDPNRYAQIMLVLLPIAYFKARREPRRWLQVALFSCGALILAGVLLTYSRGAFVTLVALLTLLAVTKAIRLRALALIAAALIAAVVAFAPGYVLRVATLQETSGLLQGTRVSQSEGVLRSRLTEMLAAWSVFVDHPFLGVGPGQYEPVYSIQYMSNPDIAFKEIGRSRRAHNLYFELAAETGILGLACFLAMVGTVQARLWRAWRRWRGERDDLAGLALGFFIAICGYLVSALFLHLSYQRYFWLLLGLAAAALHIVQSERLRARRPQRSATPVEATRGA
jgi:putative inorganic carbon (HCO3(-)) transporter